MHKFRIRSILRVRRSGSGRLRHFRTSFRHDRRPVQPQVLSIGLQIRRGVDPVVQRHGRLALGGEYYLKLELPKVNPMTKLGQPN